MFCKYAIKATWVCQTLYQRAGVGCDVGCFPLLEVRGKVCSVAVRGPNMA